MTNMNRGAWLVCAVALGCSADETHTPFSGGAGPGAASGTGAAGGGPGSSQGGAGGAGGAATGGDGGGSACEPESVASCYTGPAGTEGVGACQPGMKTCLADGSGYGPCEGETLPQGETCNTPLDDDCDNQTNEAGEGCACKPKSSAYCYTGDPKTENVGLCVGGIKTCNDAGTQFGTCEQEITPTTEDCLTPADEDCDGTSPLCGADWAVTFGNVAAQLVHAVAVDGNGNVVVVGELEGTMTLGNATLTSAGGTDAFVAKLAADGTLVWAKRVGDAANQGALGVAFDSLGNVLVTGYFAGTINFGVTGLTTAGLSDIFVAKLQAADGAQIWAQRFGSATDDQAGVAVAADSADNAVVTGYFTGTITVGSSLISGGQTDVFVAKLAAATGTATWGVRFGGLNFETPRAVVVDANDDALVAGDYFGTFPLAGSTLTSAGGSDVFLAKLEKAAGAAAWAKRLGGAGLDFGRGLSRGGNGGVVLVGEMEGKVDFGGGELTSAGGFDLFVAEYDGAGLHTQSQRFGGAGHESALDVERDGNGNFLLAGFTTGTIDFGSGPVTSAGGRDAVLAKLTSSLGPVWARSFGDNTFFQEARSVGVNASGGVLVGGHFTGTADLGKGPATSAGSTDGFVLKFPP